jgi:predicted membrane channel-forming protein YqfA (hemolysin III family)
MNAKKSTDNCHTLAQTKKNTLRLFFWSVVWVLATAGVAFGPKNLWNFNKWLTIIAVLIHIGLGLGMIRVFKQFLLGLDELQRKIHLDAMALSLGIGLVFGGSYEMLEDIKLIPFQPEIPHLLIVMSLTYAVGAILGIRKYQ